MEISKFAPEFNMNSSNRKNKHYYSSYIVVDMETGNIKIDLRLYGTQSTNYACVWFGGTCEGEKVSGAGSAKAGGYGYDRESAAAAYAFHAAGVTIDGFACTGMMEEALELVAQKLEIANFKIFHTFA